MTALITRAGKGSPLLNSEIDANAAEIERRTGAGWDDLVAPMIIQTGAPDAPTLTEWSDGMYLPEFYPNLDLSVLGYFHIGHRYKMGTMMYPHFHFSPNDDAASGVLRFGFRYKLARRHDSTGQVKFTAPVEIVLEETIPLSSAGTHFVIEVPEGQGIPATHIEPDVMIIMETFRRGNHANDTFTGSIWGLTHDIHYEVDQVQTPSRFPPFFS